MKHETFRNVYDINIMQTVIEYNRQSRNLWTAWWQ